ncbi:MAG TPA: right-handed parallel beta-helix repeat-containing protein [Thermoanaerobaculia bacterium]|nr:right-handed parallel beta-helix repeat-containing protein [Thermoanaerobaculia bacterium]
MRIAKLSVVAAVFFSILTGSAHAATFYVATSGNDANPGTLAAPFRTINKAATRVVAGDVVEVRGGTYTGPVSISSKGTSAARIIFRSYAGETAIIDGTGTAPDTNLVLFYNAEYVDFVGFDVRNATKIGVCGYPAKFTRVLNNKIHGSWTNGIYFGANSTDLTIDGNEVYDNGQNNKNHTFPNGGWPQALSVGNTNNATITNNKVYRNWGEGIDFIVATGGLARGNEVFDNFSVGIYLDNAQSIVVDRNLVYNTGDTRFYRDGEPASGIGLANESYSTTKPINNLTITNNIVLKMKWGFYYGAYDLGGGLKNVTLANNTFYNNTYGALWIDADAHFNSFVENNIFHQVGGRMMVNVAGAGVTYRSNNWYGGSAGAATGAGDVIGDPQFVNPGGFRAEDYKLLGGSRAIEAGIDLLSIASTDYFGNSRSLGVDLGAHEYSLAHASTESQVDAQAPTVPDRLLAASTSSTLVDVRWRAATDNIGVKSYVIYRNGVRVGNVTDTDYVDRWVSPSTSYSYQIAAMDAAGNISAKSAPLNVTTPAATTASRSRSVRH